MENLLKLIEKPENYEDSLSVDLQDSFNHQETSYLGFKPPKLDTIYFLDQQKDKSDYVFSKKFTTDLESSSQNEAEQIVQSFDITKESEKNKAPKFLITRIKTTRGRKTNLSMLKTKIKKKNHSKSSPDNIMTKIQSHFLNFFISLANDVLRCISGNNKLSFKPINYRCKKRVSYGYFKILKEMKISQLLNEEISGKYKLNKLINREIFMKVAHLSDWLADFFNIKYLKLFSIYYNKLKPLKKLVFQGKVITLSSQTRSFYYLLRKNKEIKDIIISIAKDAYFNGHEDYTDKFIVTKIDADEKEN